jgi:hypothetical protein
MERRTRRGFLIGMLAVPAVAVGAGAMGVARRGIAAMRPAARGTTSLTCAQCGADGHTMLDPGCPAAPKVV